MASLINGAMQQTDVFPSRCEIEDQFTTHTYTLRDTLVIILGMTTSLMRLVCSSFGGTSHWRD